MTPANIQAVLFDFGMVLSGPPDPASWTRLKQVFDADEAPFHATYWAYRDAYDRGALKGDTYWAAVAHDLQQPLTGDQLSELLAADTDLWTQPNQPMIDWAAHLQNANVKTGILSNMPDAMETGILNHFPWLHNFTHTTFSHRLRIAKPDAAIYQHAIKGLAIPAEAILFIDDREENIAAARDAGMNAIQYTTHEAFVVEMRRLGLGDLL